MPLVLKTHAHLTGPQTAGLIGKLQSQRLFRGWSGSVLLFWTLEMGSCQVRIQTRFDVVFASVHVKLLWSCLCFCSCNALVVMCLSLLLSMQCSCGHVFDFCFCPCNTFLVMSLSLLLPMQYSYGHVFVFCDYVFVLACVHALICLCFCPRNTLVVVS